MRDLFLEHDAHRGRMRMAHRIAHGLLAMRSSSCWRSGARPSPIMAPSKLQVDAAVDGGAFGELAERELEAHAPGLVGAQRHHRAARVGEALASPGRGCA